MLLLFFKNKIRSLHFSLVLNLHEGPQNSTKDTRLLIINDMSSFFPFMKVILASLDPDPQHWYSKNSLTSQIHYVKCETRHTYGTTLREMIQMNHIFLFQIKKPINFLFRRFYNKVYFMRVLVYWMSERHDFLPSSLSCWFRFTSNPWTHLAWFKKE